MQENEVRAATLPSLDPQKDEPKDRVAQKAHPVKMVRIGGELFDREFAVLSIKEEYPRFDNSLLTKALHPDDYGVQLVPGAVRAVTGKVDKRRYHKRISARISDDAFETLTAHIAAKGFPSVQAWLSHLLIDYMREEGLIDV